MNREQMIEKAAEDLYLRVMVETRDEWPHFEFLPTAAQDLWLSDATKLIDAILPQVSTHEELEALGDRALLLGAPVGKFPAVFKWTNGQLYYGDGGRVENLDPLFGPLTVVWQPLRDWR